MHLVISSASGKLPVKADKIETGLWKCDKYSIKLDKSSTGWHSNNSCIIGDSQRPELEPTEMESFGSRELLDSLIALSNDVVDYRKRKKRIIDWVKRYGLPFVDEDMSEEAHSFVCPLGKFMEFLWELRDVILKIETINREDFNLSGGRKTVNNPYNKAKWSDDKLERLISEWVNDASVSVRIRFENHSPHLFLVADSILSVAKYQLALLLLCNEGITPKRCACCNSYFLPSRENQIYCPYCSPQKHYARKRRALKKQMTGGTNHG